MRRAGYWFGRRVVFGLALECNERDEPKIDHCQCQPPARYPSPAATCCSLASRVATLWAYIIATSCAFRQVDQTNGHFVAQLDRVGRSLSWPIIRNEFRSRRSSENLAEPTFGFKLKSGHI